MVPVSHYLLFAALLFGIGALGVVTRRSALTVFMCVELMLNAANLTFLAFAREQLGSRGLSGHAIAILVMAVAAAEAAVGLAIVIAVFRTRGTVNLDEVKTLKL
ncbi:MAG: NADH-quinone oxidoreductase subunit NuoK [Deltaproteobacteria bacterium]|nr:NADH-quinone oxidoreductase subunit NuoK [Deltaproteobacteria bacterium]